MLVNLEDHPDILILGKKEKIKQIPIDIIEPKFLDLEESLGVNLYSFLGRYYEILGRFSIAWNYTIDNAENPGGEIRLINFSTIFFSKFKLYYNEMPDEKIALLKSLLPFDDHPTIGDGTLSAFRINPLSQIPEIWYYDNGDAFKINLSIDAYIEHSLRTRGFLGWQFLFCSLNWNDELNDFRLERIGKLVKDLPQLFPGEDFSSYEELYHDILKTK